MNDVIEMVLLNLKQESKRREEKKKRESMCACPTQEDEDDNETAYASDHEYEEKVIAYYFSSPFFIYTDINKDFFSFMRGVILRSRYPNELLIDRRR